MLAIQAGVHLNASCFLLCISLHAAEEPGKSAVSLAVTITEHSPSGKSLKESLASGFHSQRILFFLFFKVVDFFL